MNQEKRKNKLTILLIAALAISLAANIVLGVMVVNQKNDSDKYLYDPNYALGGDDAEVIVEGTEAEQLVEIPLQLIKLNYSEDLKDQITVEVEEEENYAVIRFFGAISEKNLELFFFELTPDNNTEDFILGTLHDSQYGELYVVMHMNEQNPEDWIEEEYNEICGLQERVNDIIIQFYGDERFVPNR